MPRPSSFAALLGACALAAAGAAFAPAAEAAAGASAGEASKPRPAAARPNEHRSATQARKRRTTAVPAGRQVGKASFYADKFAGRKMADGTPMNPRADIAASKTLPLGTKARVTNLETGKSAVVTVKDRGPYVQGRIVDLSPATARKVGITRADGVADVEVVPLSVPKPDAAGGAR